MPAKVQTITTGLVVWRPPHSVFVPGQTISPSIIPTGQSWPTPSVIGNVNITPATAIASGESWPTPFINLEQRIIPGAKIPSGEAWFSPMVSITEIVAPTKIPTGEHWFTPIIRGQTQFVNVFGITSGESWPTPAVQGGNGSLQIWIANKNVTQLTNGLNGGLSAAGAGTNASAAQITSQAIGRATMTFDMIDLNQTLVGPSGIFPSVQSMAGLTVRVVELGVTLFAGCIDTVGVDREQPFVGTVAIVYHITALDKSSICDHRVVTAATYAAGTDIVAVILDIVSNYLNGEGVTTQGVPLAGSLGTLDSDQTFNYVTVTSAFNTIGTLSGTIWWIDQYGVLFFSALTSLPSAPWAVTETAAIRRSAGTSMVQLSLSGSSATSGYRNKEYVVSNLNVLPSSATEGGGSSASQVTETFSFANGNAGVISQYISGVLTPVAISVSLPIQSVSSMTVNGNDQTTVEFGTFNGQTSSGPTDYLWFWTQGGTELSWVDGPVPTNAAISITYIPGNAQGTQQTSVVVGTALSPTGAGGAKLGTCGSGIFEYADQVKNISSIADLNALAADFLARSGGIPVILTFETDRPGLFVGQSLPVSLPTLSLGTVLLPVNLVITEVQGTAQSRPLGFGSFFRWTVTAINNYDAANWVTYWSRFLELSDNALPLLRYETAKFITGGGATLSSGNTITNPYIVDQTGLVSSITIAASVPPSDQNLVVTITKNGTPVATVVFPAGSTPNLAQVTAVPATNQLYVFTNDVLNVNISYQLTGGSPTNASGVTIQMTWSY